MTGKKENVNFNTIILAALTVTTGLSGWGLTKAYNHLEENLSELRISIMPRQEIQLRLEQIENRMKSLETQVQELSNRSKP